ncbi:endonuclease domain-containing protein [Rhodococcus sp. 1168]|uniref:endonuclease domain-containing protein n=1 Tax=Rhodococcus sp. 1168 TaxID=2018041 RepID=UPI000B5B03D6
MICAGCRQDLTAEHFAPSAPLWPEKTHYCRPCDRRRVQIAKHGIDTGQRAEIAAHQGGCSICGHPEPSSRGWMVDHDHECCSGEKSCPKCRRGVVCHWCNVLLANAFDRPQILRAAADYLEAEKSCVWHMPVACAKRICGKDERPA